MIIKNDISFYSDMILPITGVEEEGCFVTVWQSEPKTDETSEQGQDVQGFKEF